MQKIFRNGFTLIEVLLVIAILAILASVVIIAINPSRQLGTARDAQRLSDVYAILGALHQYAANNDGSFPSEITTENKEICKTQSVSCVGLYDLSMLTTEERYLVSMPEDPLCPRDSAYCSEDGTGYFVAKTENGRVRVSAPSVELADDMVVTR